MAALSATERIRKPADSIAPEEQSPATDVMMKAPTALELAALPRTASQPLPDSSVWPQVLRWLAIVAMAVLFGVSLALIWK